MLRPTSSLESMRLGAWGDAMGDSIGFGTEEVPARSWPGAALVGEVGAPPAPGEPHAPFGLEGFRESGIVLSAWGLEGLSTFGDSPPARALFAEGSELMSWGTLHRVS
jgi:hypothetical protein